MTRRIITRTTDSLVAPDATERATAASLWGSADAHDGFMANWPAMSRIELRQPPQGRSSGQTRIAAWNLERCKKPLASATVIRDCGIDILLATELDIGMARSGQAHTPEELAGHLGYGYAFGVEFVELGTGDTHETQLFKDLENECGLHGNAIFSRYPIQNAALIPIDDGSEWFVRAPKNDGQHRVGGRMAIAAELETPDGPLAVAAVHYESESTPATRGEQTRRMLAAMDGLYGDLPVVIGGDLNTATLAADTHSRHQRLNEPQDDEPCFQIFAAHDYRWGDGNTGETTTRHPPNRIIRHPHKTIDWLFVRGGRLFDPAVIPAVLDDDDYLSDHDMVAAYLSLS